MKVGKRYSTSSPCNQPDNLQDQRLVKIFLHLCCLAHHQPAGQQAQQENSRYPRWLARQWLSPVLSGQPGRTMENSLTRERSSCKMSSLSFTLIYHFTGLVLFSVCPAKASIWRTFKCFYDKTCFFVRSVAFDLFDTNPLNKKKQTNKTNATKKC